MNELELKRKRWERIGKVVGLAIAGFIFAPFAYATITGLISLLVVATIALVAVNVGVPWFSISLANWRLKAIKAAAAANPIEILENRYSQKETALLGQRENIKKRIAIATKIFSQIETFEAQFKKPSPRRVQYEKLNTLTNISKANYQKAKIALVAFGDFIKEKTADWEIVQSITEANKLAQVGEDFTSKLMEDTALNTIQNGLDLAFAELDASVMDENIDKLLSGQDVDITSVVVKAAPTASPKQLAAPVSELDFDFNGTAESEPVTVKRQKIAVA